MHYLVGDIQGCDGALDRLLEKIDFSPSRDRVYVLGDLVNRGPGSLATLRRLRDLGESATCVLGNHDWHLLAVAAGVRPRHRSDTIDDILDAPDREAGLDWLRQRRMAVFEQGWLMLHAGVVPQWDLATTLGLAGELETALRERPTREFLGAMFGNEPLVTLSKEAPLVRDIAGRHHVAIGGLSVASDGRHAVVVATIDNLLGGAATQAVRNLNLTLGFPELLGIDAASH